MTGLARLQEDFHAYLLYGEQRVTARVAGTARASAEERLAVYGNAYRLRLLEALENDFPALKTLLGDGEFATLGRAYIDAHPSRHPSLRWFGTHLSNFVQRTPPYDAQPLLAELAAFEWAQGEVFDAEDAVALSIEDIAALPPTAWPAMRLEFHPSVRRLNLDWNAPSMWQAIDKHETFPALEKAAITTPWLLWRKQLEIHWRSLGAEEAWAIDVCLRGETFGELCAGLCEWTEESQAALRAAGLLKRWVTDEIIAHVICD
ncbi:MAG: HvfC/BufC N-terminal domain-containing protein [Gammaproteobacteria bacterium]|nr:putative DNA-binding domain-containing protein [Gammaproteobacteria bacterium]